MAEKGRIFTGARAILAFAGKPIGYAKNCNSGENINHEPFTGLGQIEVIENVPVGYAISFSASFARLVGENLQTLGIQPKVGATPEELLQNILDLGDLTATISDRKTKKVLESVEQLRFSSRRTSYQAGSIVMTDVEFVGIKIRTEAEV